MNKDTAAMRGIRTAIQSVIGIFVGLIAAVWAVPGVPETVTNYLSSHWGQLIVLFGIPTGLASFVWNVFRKDVDNF